MEEDMEKTCPRCGMKLGEFRKTGLLGCAGCYCAFREEILPTVRRVQQFTEIIVEEVRTTYMQVEIISARVPALGL